VNKLAQGQKRNQTLVKQASHALDKLKWEVANELGIQVPNGGYMGDIPSRLTGAMGGEMVRRMIAAAEQSLINQATAEVHAGFQQALQNVNINANIPPPQQPS
jgi:hypothetical protein